MRNVWCGTVLMLASFAPVGQAQSVVETWTRAPVHVAVPEPSSLGLQAIDLLFFGLLSLCSAVGLFVENDRRILRGEGEE